MEHQFSGVNTVISVKEQTLLTEKQWQDLLNATSFEALKLVLTGTPYEMTVSQLANPDMIEQILMQQLKETYDFLFEATPQSEIVEIFAAQYLFHNLKVLLKTKATQQSLEHLLIPIGKYSIDILKHLVETLESAVVDDSVVLEVRNTWNDYETYQIIDAIDIGCDGGYFRYLRTLQQRIHDDSISKLIDVLIDFYNFITVLRAKEMKKSRSFMYTMMTQQGQFSKNEVIEIIETNQLSRLFDHLENPFFGRKFDRFIEKMTVGSITARELEQLKDTYLSYLFDSHQLDIQGPFQVLRYLFKKELEVSNLRLILTGFVNGLSKGQISERMTMNGNEIV